MIFENKLVRRIVFGSVYGLALIVGLILLLLDACNVIPVVAECLFFELLTFASVGLIWLSKDIFVESVLGKVFSVIGHFIFYISALLTLLPMAFSTSGDEMTLFDRNVIMLALAFDLISMVHYLIYSRFFDIDEYVNKQCYIMLISVVFSPLAMILNIVGTMPYLLLFIILLPFFLTNLLSISKINFWTIAGIYWNFCVFISSVSMCIEVGILYGYMLLSFILFIVAFLIIAKIGDVYDSIGIFDCDISFIIYFFVSIIIEIVVSCFWMTCWWGCSLGLVAYLGVEYFLYRKEYVGYSDSYISKGTSHSSSSPSSSSYDPDNDQNNVYKVNDVLKYRSLFSNTMDYCCDAHIEDVRLECFTIVVTVHVTYFSIISVIGNPDRNKVFEYAMNNVEKEATRLIDNECSKYDFDSVRTWRVEIKDLS